MSLALYRTYRPSRLDEVVGQEHVTEPLRRALLNGKVHHAYLFSGPRGCGKTSTARILARSLNCAEGPTPDPCGECQSCVDLAPNGPGSLDVVEIDAATHRGVDDARELRERAIYAPASSRYKIYIIDEAHQLTNDASNALLKLVEEPPEHLRFVFATTEPDKIIPTIRSRTFHYSFRLVPSRVLASHLAAVCEREGVTAEPAALALVTRAGSGSVRDALSVLGQVIAGAGPEGVAYAEVAAQLGQTDEALLDTVVDAIAASDGAALFHAVDTVISAGHDPRRFVTDLLERLRELLILKNVPDALDTGLLDLPDDLAASMRSQADKLGNAEISRLADLVSAALTEIKGATAPRLQLELLCARLILPEVEGPAGLAARLDRLERKVSQAAVEGFAHAAVPASPGPAPSGTASPGPATQAPAAPARPAPQVAAPAAPAQPAPTPAPTPAPSATPAPTPTAAPAPAAGPPAAGSAPRAPWKSGSRPSARPAEQAAAPAQSPTAQSPTAQSPTAQTPTAQTPTAPAPAATAPAAPARDLEAVRTMWPGVLEALKERSRMAWSALADSRPLSVDGGRLAVGLPNSGAFAYLRQGGHDERLRQSIIDVVKIDVLIDLVLDPGSAGAVSPAAPPVPEPVDQEPGEAEDFTPAPAVPEPALSEPAVPERAKPEPGPEQHRPEQHRPAPPSPAQPQPDQPSTLSRRMRGRAAAATVEPEVPDVPSLDDPDLETSGLSGEALVMRELGATRIGEIES